MIQDKEMSICFDSEIETFLWQCTWVLFQSSVFNSFCGVKRAPTWSRLIDERKTNHRVLSTDFQTWQNQGIPLGSRYIHRDSCGGISLTQAPLVAAGEPLRLCASRAKVQGFHNSSVWWHKFLLAVPSTPEMMIENIKYLVTVSAVFLSKLIIMEKHA